MVAPSPSGRTQGRTVILVVLGMLVAFLAFIFYVGATGGGTSNRPPPSREAAPDARSSH